MDVFEKPYWNLIQVLAWVYCGDRRLVRRADADNTDHGSFWQEVRLPDGRTELIETPSEPPGFISIAVTAEINGGAAFASFREAEDAVLNALRESRLHAWGLENNQGDLKEVPAIQWAELTFYDRPPLAASKNYFRPGATKWHALQFRRIEVFELWPDELADVSSQDHDDDIDLSDYRAIFSIATDKTLPDKPHLEAVEALTWIACGECRPAVAVRTAQLYLLMKWNSGNPAALLDRLKERNSGRGQVNNDVSEGETWDSIIDRLSAQTGQTLEQLEAGLSTDVNILSNWRERITRAEAVFLNAAKTGKIQILGIEHLPGKEPVPGTLYATIPTDYLVNNVAVNILHNSLALSYSASDDEMSRWRGPNYKDLRTPTAQVRAIWPLWIGDQQHAALTGENQENASRPRHRRPDVRTRCEIALKGLFPPNGHPPVQTKRLDLHSQVNAWLKAEGKPGVSLDTLRRAIGVRRDRPRNRA